MTLRRPDHVIAFTDRPVRESERLRVGWLVGSWDQMFDSDPPNAALSGVSADGKAVELIVEVLDLTGDESDLIVTVRAVGDDRDVEVPTRLRDVALFIDDAVLVADRDAYVARSQVGVPDGDPAEDAIYSFPATALVENYPVRHLGDE